MKLNRKWLLLAALVLSVAMATTGTLAYLTDEDEDVNTMTMGNVKVEQLEYERYFDDNGELLGMREFTDNQALYPVYTTKGTEVWQPSNNDLFYYKDYIDGAPGGNGLWDNMVGELDKFVFVKNTGKSDLYYRTWIAFEAPDEVDTKNAAGQRLIHRNINSHANFKWYPTDSDGFLGRIEIDGNNYDVFVAVYTAALTPGEISRPSLLQVAMDPIADNDYVAQFGDTYEILTFTQAVQTANMPDAETALNAAFGPLQNADGSINHPWTDGISSDTSKPLAKVTEIRADQTLTRTTDDGETVTIVNPGRKVGLHDYGAMTDDGEIELDVAYQFQPSISYEEVLTNEYRYWHADFVVKANKDIPSYGIGLAGYYSLFGDLMTGEKWIMLATDETIPADTEIRLVLDGLGATLNFEEICNYGNDGIGFLCGAAALTGQLDGAEALTPGTELTVELRLYETEETSEENGSVNIETSDYITVGTFRYTFD